MTYRPILLISFIIFLCLFLFVFFLFFFLLLLGPETLTSIDRRGHIIHINIIMIIVIVMSLVVRYLTS